MRKLFAATMVMGLAFFAFNTAALADCSAGHQTKSATQVGETKQKVEKDIIETAVSAESFSTLVAAVKAAGLVEALKGDGPFTVFAPTDEAFAKLPEGTVESLLKNKEQLVKILKYHVVGGMYTSKEVADGNLVETLNGQKVQFSVKDKDVMVNNASVVAKDIVCSNGVIHVIDTVILPEMES